MTERSITITRVFDAPPDRIWREWTEPERFADWYGGAAAEVPLSTVTMDVRPGGLLRLTMLYSGREIQWQGEYREVVPPQRLVFTITDMPHEDARALITVVLTDLGDGRTEMHFEQRGPLPPELYEAAKSGWGAFFDRVDERLVTP
jgi:uncharacterized protein YndB with AHSA1/START domain